MLLSTVESRKQFLLVYCIVVRMPLVEWRYLPYSARLVSCWYSRVVDEYSPLTFGGVWGKIKFLLVFIVSWSTQA